jgi:hypothetical protein
VGNKVRSYPEHDLTWMTDGSLDWLRDDQQLTDYLSQGYVRHAALGPDHQQCAAFPVELLIAWVDYKPLADGNAPFAALGTIAVRLPGAHAGHIDIRRKPWGAEIIGSGALAGPAIDTDENFGHVANMGPAGVAGQLRCMLVAQMLRSEMEAQGEQTVGGLYQLIHLSAVGVESVPYFYRARVAPGFGTYVAMRLENGLWVQQHRPTGVLRPVLSPFDPALTNQGAVVTGAHEMFEPSQFLNPDSPGVLPEPRMALAYVQYDPAHVPAEVIASWGPAALPPSTGHVPPAPQGEE